MDTYKLIEIAILSLTQIVMTWIIVNGLVEAWSVWWDRE